MSTGDISLLCMVIFIVYEVVLYLYKMVDDLYHRACLKIDDKFIYVHNVTKSIDNLSLHLSTLNANQSDLLHLKKISEFQNAVCRYVPLIVRIFNDKFAAVTRKLPDCSIATARDQSWIQEINKLLETKESKSDEPSEPVEKTKPVEEMKPVEKTKLVDKTKPVEKNESRRNA